MTPSRWNLLTCSRTRALSPSEQFFAYADAYRDSAQRLCVAIARGPRKATFERGAVVLYLASHAVELFLKGAVLRKAPTERFVHDLEHLHNRYDALYRGKRYRFTERPFRTEYLGMTKKEAADVKKMEVPPNELYRYPVSKGGQPWRGAFGFEATSYLRVLETLREDFARLRSAYDA